MLRFHKLYTYYAGFVAFSLLCAGSYWFCQLANSFPVKVNSLVMLRIVAILRVITVVSSWTKFHPQQPGQVIVGLRAHCRRECQCEDFTSLQERCKEAEIQFLSSFAPLHYEQEANKGLDCMKCWRVGSFDFFFLSFSFTECLFLCSFYLCIF